METAPHVFISYHRADAEADVGRLGDTLKRRLGESRVFIDVSDIEYGSNWERVVEHTLDGSVAILLVAGPEWQLTEAITYELSAAIDAGITIIPIVVRRANWVTLTSGLPSRLQELRKSNAVALEHGKWDRDVEPLVVLLERMLADPSRARAICRPPAPAALLCEYLNRRSIRWLLFHAADLAECLADPTVLSEAQEAASKEGPPPPLEAPNADRVPPYLIHVLGNARSRLSIEETAQDLLRAGGQYAARLLEDRALEQKILERWKEFSEAKSEWSRTRGDSDANPAACLRDAEEVDEEARNQLRARLPGLTRDRDVQERLFKLVENEVRRIVTQKKVNDHWEYIILKRFAECPDKRFEIRDDDRDRVRAMLEAFEAAVATKTSVPGT